MFSTFWTEKEQEDCHKPKEAWCKSSISKLWVSFKKENGAIYAWKNNPNAIRIEFEYNEPCYEIGLKSYKGQTPTPELLKEI
jgi:hypothetical protein